MFSINMIYHIQNVRTSNILYCADSLEELSDGFSESLDCVFVLSHCSLSFISVLDFSVELTSLHREFSEV